MSAAKNILLVQLVMLYILTPSTGHQSVEGTARHNAIVNDFPLTTTHPFKLFTACYFCLLRIVPVSIHHHGRKVEAVSSMGNT